jgi:hypothetical protein
MHLEPIGKVKAINSIEATISAATIKQLGIDIFLQLFEIEEYDRGSKEKNGNAS